MKFEIKHRYTNEILFSCEGGSWKSAVELAIKSKANLSYANLSSADLSSADLSYANLSSADLRYANLSYADLSYANLRSANLSYADLSYANTMTFQYQQHLAYYTFDGGLRIGCILMPITEWELGFEEIGKTNGYNDEQILMYGQFIKMCLEHFKRNNK